MLSISALAVTTTSLLLAVAYSSSSSTDSAVEAQAQIVSPPEGSRLVNLDFVRVSLNVWTPSPSDFARDLKNGSLCLSLDKGPYACWELFEMVTPPAFVNVSAGNHTLEALVADSNGNPMRRTWSGVRRFTSVFEEVPQGPISTVQATDAPPEVVEEGESMPIPKVVLETPLEMTSTLSKLEISYSVTTTAPEQFKKLFQHSFACFDLENTSPCWPLFAQGTRPRWTWLGDGFRLVKGYLLHPDTLKPVPETSSTFRAIVTHRSTGPASNNLNDDDESTFLLTAGGDSSNGWRRTTHEDGRDYYYNDTTSQWETPMGFPAPLPEPCVESVASFEIDAKTRVLPIRKLEQADVAADRFCRAQAILNPNCAMILAENIRQSAALRCEEEQIESTETPPPPPREETPLAQEEEEENIPRVVVPRHSQVGREDREAVSAVSKTDIDRLRSLKEAFELGLLTRSEYDNKRATVVDAM